MYTAATSDVAAQVDAMVGIVKNGLSSNSIATTFTVSMALPPPTANKKSASFTDAICAISLPRAKVHSPPKWIISSTLIPALSSTGRMCGKALERAVSPPMIATDLPYIFVNFGIASNTS